MEIKTVSLVVFAAINQDVDKVFAVRNIKSICGEVVDAVNLYAAKQYGTDVIVQTTELQDVENSTMYDAKNIVQSDDDAIMLALNAIV